MDSAPRVPAEKLSINRTQLRSNGTVVPPEVTQTTGRTSRWVLLPVPHASGAAWSARNVATAIPTSRLSSGHPEKKSVTSSGSTMPLSARKAA